MGAPTQMDSENAIDVVGVAASVFKVIFSWAVLMPIAVIVSGILLAEVFQTKSQPNNQTQFFGIPIPKFLNFSASGDAVVFGFAGFLITLLVLGSCIGKLLYEKFKTQFGIDPGQFNCLCIYSSLANVSWSCILFLIFRPKVKKAERLAVEHTRLIEQVTQKDRE